LGIDIEGEATVCTCLALTFETTVYFVGVGALFQMYQQNYDPGGFLYLSD